MNKKQQLSNIIQEFQEDLKKQCVVLMGLPASGKSTFVKTELKKYIPAMIEFSVTNSDSQVAASQYQLAKDHFEWLLQNVKSEKDINKFVNDSEYTGNKQNKIKIPLTYNWWNDNAQKGLKFYYSTFYKPYYATYFDLRDAARQKTAELFTTKIYKSDSILVIDTVAAKYEKIFKELKIAKDNNFNNTIIYLDIDVDLSIKRDNWRQEHQGRGVGNEVIESYAKVMEQAYKEYQKNGQKDDGVVDRLMHFVWRQHGDSPIAGNWIKKDDFRYGLKRKLKNK